MNRGLRQTLYVFLCFSAGYFLCLYHEGRLPIWKTAAGVPLEFRGLPEIVPLRKDCRHLPPILTNDDLPTLCDTPVRRKLNKPVQNDTSLRLRPDDPRVINFIRTNCDVLLRPPDGIPTAYKAMGASRGQDEIAIRLLKNMTGGFFVEFGALDGVTESNSLRFERDLGWKGLLIEPDPENLVRLYQTHRNAWISHSCVAVKPFPHEVIFQPSYNVGKITEILGRNNATTPLTNGLGLIRLQCFPLYSHLLALNVSVVDFMSVDVEGFELDVLKTIPFDKVFFKVVIVEIVTSPTPGPTQEFMESQGFKTVGMIYRQPDLKPHDLVFVHNSMQVEQSAIDLINSKYFNPEFYLYVNFTNTTVGPR